MMTRPDGEPPRYQGRVSIRSSRGSLAAAVVIGAIALLLVGIPLAYRSGTETPSATPPLALSPTLRPAAPTPTSPQPSAGTSATSTAMGPSAVDRALERMRVADIFGYPADHDCRVEAIPKRSERSVRLGGQVEAHDHGGWVFTCRHETGDRTRYFELASGITRALERIGTTFQGGTSYVGRPGGTIETRWSVRGDVLSGEIEMLTVTSGAKTLTIIVLIDLRGSWQSAPPPS